MVTAYTLKIDVGAANRTGLSHAQRIVTGTTLRTFTRAVILTPVRTGNLKAQNRWRVKIQGLSAVGEIWNDTSYAKAVHDGTKSYVIRPKRRKALRFEIAGEVVFAKKVTMPARRGKPWLYRALVETAIPEGYKLVRT